MLEAALPPGREAEAIAAWEALARAMLAALGWADARTRVRRFGPAGASLYLSAPADCLYAATEVNEWACEGASLALAGTPPPVEPARERLDAAIRAERNPALLALRTAAERHGVACLADERLVTVGMGTGSRTWPTAELPAPGDVDWAAVHDVPAALVTGSNGKTTCVRLLAAVLAGTGQVAGYCCTDSIHVGGELLARGDYSGPGGARALLRDRRVELAALETARGGILRRGLALTRAAAALVTNIAADHLGEYGILTEDAMADAKLVVARPVPPDGTVVLNAEDSRLAARAVGLASRLGWFALDPANPVLAAHAAGGGLGCTLDGETIVLLREGRREPVTTLDLVPLTLGGAARYNVANVLAVTAVAAAMGVEPEAIAGRLGAFQPSTADNPGRLNLFDLGGVQVVLDFAHNPHGIAALVETARAMPAARRLILLGQAGDRDDEAIRELVRTAARLGPDCWAVKDMEHYRRGRQPGEVPAVMVAEIRRLAGPRAPILQGDTELDAVRRALRWARAGDLLLLTVHAQRDEVLALLERLRVLGWRAGERLG